MPNKIINNLDDDALPNIPLPSAEQLAANDAIQAKLAERHTPNRNSREYGRSMAVVKELEAMPAADLGKRQITQLIDAYEHLGQFDKAYTLSGDDRHKQLWDAVTGDAKECDCKDFSTVELVDGVVTPVQHSRMFVKREIYNVTTGLTSKLVACNLCGNAYLV